MGIFEVLQGPFSRKSSFSPALQRARVYEDRTFITSSINPMFSAVMRDGSSVSQAVKVLVLQGKQTHPSGSIRCMSATSALRDRTP
jgi:hypothetical protein